MRWWRVGEGDGLGTFDFAAKGQRGRGGRDFCLLCLCGLIGCHWLLPPFELHRSAARAQRCGEVVVGGSIFTSVALSNYYCQALSMNRIGITSLLIFALALSSCTTGDAIACAKGEEQKWFTGFGTGQPTKGKKKPGYYLLVPFTAVYDVVSFPYWCWKLRDFHG